MKKIIFTVIVLFILSPYALAGDIPEAQLTKVGDKVSLSALLETTKENCSKTEIGVYGSSQTYEIDKELFYKTAEKITLTDIENTLITNPSGSIIIRCYENGDIHEVTVWENCTVAGSRVSSTSAPTGDYIIKAKDFEKLASFLPDEAKPKLSPLKSLYARVICQPTAVYVISVLLLIIIGIGYKIKKKH